MADEPANDTILEKDSKGRLFIVEMAPDGTTTRTPATAAAALAYVDRLVAAYGADNVPVGSLQPGQGGVADHVLTRTELVDQLRYLTERLRKENHGNDAATITALRAA